MSFHRFIDPSYNEASGWTSGDPIDGVTYDYINVTSGGVGAGGSAPADAAKTGGTNPGTYWVSQSEAALGLHANRGMRALAEGADHLDDLLHRDLATPARVAFVSPGGAVSNFVITDDVFVGDIAGPTEEERAGLVQLKDLNGEPLTEFVGGLWVPVRVTSITNEGNGWQTNPTVAVSPDISTGHDYTVLYYARKSPASQDQGVLSEQLRYTGYWETTLQAHVNSIRNGLFSFAGDKTFGGLTTFNAAVTIAAGGLGVTAGIEVSTGDLDVTLGNVDIAAGTLDVEGTLTVDAGNLDLDNGSLGVAIGNVDVTVGDVNVVAGDVNLDAGEVLYNPGRARTTLHPLFDFVEDVTSNGVIVAYASNSISAGDTFVVMFPIRLPHGAILNSVNIKHQNLAAKNSFRMMVGTVGVNDTTAPSTSDERNFTSIKAVGVQTDTLTNGGFPLTIDNETKLYWVVFEGNQSGAAVYNIKLNWVDIGPGH